MISPSEIPKWVLSLWPSSRAQWKMEGRRLSIILSIEMEGKRCWPGIGKDSVCNSKQEFSGRKCDIREAEANLEAAGVILHRCHVIYIGLENNRTWADGNMSQDANIHFFKYHLTPAYEILTVKQAPETPHCSGKTTINSSHCKCHVTLY